MSIHIDGYTDKILDFSGLSFAGTGPEVEAKDLTVDIKFTILQIYMESILDI